MMTEDEAALWAQLEGIFDGVEETTVKVFELTDWELMNMFADTTESLRKLKMLLKPTTQEARELHSLRNSVQLEMRKRGLS